jgi:hypothetical protein
MGTKVNSAAKSLSRYAAKLMFQFRVVIDGDSGQRRTCEERIVLIDAMSARKALREAQRRGKKAQFHFQNTDGNPVYFEFIGVMDLQELGIECADGEVWYDIVERLLPSERSEKFIPPAAELNAIKLESLAKARKGPCAK